MQHDVGNLQQHSAGDIFIFLLRDEAVKIFMVLQCNAICIHSFVRPFNEYGGAI